MTRVQMQTSSPLLVVLSVGRSWVSTNHNSQSQPTHETRGSVRYPQTVPGFQPTDSATAQQRVMKACNCLQWKSTPGSLQLYPHATSSLEKLEKNVPPELSGRLCRATTA